VIYALLSLFSSLQVPQFILDDMIESELGGSCNIVCTQPWRIAVQSQCSSLSFLPGGHHHKINNGIMQKLHALLMKSLAMLYIESHIVTFEILHYQETICCGGHSFHIY